MELKLELLEYQETAIKSVVEVGYCQIWFFD